MKRIIVYFILFLITACANAKGILIYERHQIVTLKNDFIQIDFNLKSGTYKAIDINKGIEGIFNACWEINNCSSKEAKSIKYRTFSFIDKIGKGVTIELTSFFPHAPETVFLFSIYENQPFILAYGGIRNDTGSDYTIKEISPLYEASIFKGLDISKNFRLIDGEGGGAATYVRDVPSLYSQNDMIVHFGDNQNYHSLIVGGISYSEFSKFSQFGGIINRKEEVEKDSIKGLKLLSYVDLGNSYNSSNYITVNRGSNYTFQSHNSFEEVRSIVWDDDEVILSLNHLDKNHKYVAGLSWCSDAKTRKQSVFLKYGDREIQMVPSSQLPSLDANENPEIRYFEIPQEANSLNPQIIIKKESGANVVASELILYEGNLSNDLKNISKSISIKYNDFSKCKVSLFAKDVIGKLVDKNQQYIADKDGFYIDFITPNPIYSAEKYAQTLKAKQNIELNYYYFPTVCLWYAMEPRYGGGTVLGTNDSNGAVDEMQRIKDSGFLKYTKVAVRLVPDCYEDNNENGWWDDKHWRMHGSGNQNAGMKLKGAHYSPPYDTTKKWAEKVLELGGLPFIYFQTAVRSNDFAEAYPNYMLFNESYHKVNNFDWLNKNYASYDFTDKGFTNHMVDVYKNLHNGGIKGMMFDYPYTGWPIYGGMEDKHSTAAGAYRTIFKLAYEGLGKTSYIHERNLVYGSDIALGYIASQRTWGDTDILTPEMVMRSGLRWYKNRVVVNYDMDAKNLLKAYNPNNEDGINKLLTMSYVTASRLLLANSFGLLKPKLLYKLSRIFPYQDIPQSARPLDVFTSDYPRVYGLRVDKDWTELTFFNEDEDSTKEIKINLSGIEGRGGAGLDSHSTYYIYDFWNDSLIGKYKGTDIFRQILRKGEARQMSVRKVVSHPQVLSTDRHIMQGMLELSNLKWDKGPKQLSGKVKVVKDELLTITIANNGYIPRIASANNLAEISIEKVSKNLSKLKIKSNKSEIIPWVFMFK